MRQPRGHERGIAGIASLICDVVVGIREGYPHPLSLPPLTGKGADLIYQRQHLWKQALSHVCAEQWSWSCWQGHRWAALRMCEPYGGMAGDRRLPTLNTWQVGKLALREKKNMRSASDPFTICTTWGRRSCPFPRQLRRVDHTNRGVGNHPKNVSIGALAPPLIFHMMVCTGERSYNSCYL